MGTILILIGDALQRLGTRRHRRARRPTIILKSGPSSIPGRRR